MDAELIDPERDPEWDRLVLQRAGIDHHAYHLAAWKQVHRRAYGPDLFYLAARNANGELAAGLPVWIRGSRLRALPAALLPGTDPGPSSRRQLLSLVDGGPLGTDLDARAATLSRACQLVDERGLHDLTITTDVRGCEQLEPKLQVKSFNPGWVTALPKDPDELLRRWKKHSRNLYRSITKAEQRGAVVRAARSTRDLWSFYRQQIQTARRLRAVPRSWLEIRLAHKLLAPRGHCRVWLVEHQGEVVAGAMFLILGNVIEPLYIGSDPRADDVRPAHAVYWHAIKWAIANGLTTINWGNAPAENSLGKFKRQWSAEPIEFFRYVYEPAGDGSNRRDRPERTVAPGDGDTTSGKGYGVPSTGSRRAPNHTGLVTALWDRVPTDALGVGATIAHRLG